MHSIELGSDCHRLRFIGTRGVVYEEGLEELLSCKKHFATNNKALRSHLLRSQDCWHRYSSLTRSSRKRCSRSKPSPAGPASIVLSSALVSGGCVISHASTSIRVSWAGLPCLVRRNAMRSLSDVCCNLGHLRRSTTKVYLHLARANFINKVYRSMFMQCNLILNLLSQICRPCPREVAKSQMQQHFKGNDGVAVRHYYDQMPQCVKARMVYC